MKKAKASTIYFCYQSEIWNAFIGAMNGQKSKLNCMI